MSERKTAIVYARVSTTRQADEELPIDGQIEHCKAKAESLGADVIKVFRDDGRSGRNDDRPAFQDAINFCDIRNPDFLITWSSSRFARNRVDASYYKERRLKQAGVELVYVSMDVDTSTTGGWLLDGVLELFDELYSKQIAADTMRSMVKNAKAGYWNGGTPALGYTSVPAEDNPKRKRLQVVPHEAEIVRKMFSMRVDGHGAKKIAIKMNELGLLNRGNPWHQNSVATLLRNQVVIGSVVFNKKDRATNRVRPRDQWLVVPAHEPIISIDVWDTVQEAMTMDAPDKAGSAVSSFFFTGILRCGLCGATMQIEKATGGTGKKYSYYNCRRHRVYGDCDGRRISAEAMDDFLVDHIASEVFTKKNLYGVVDELNSACGTWATEHRRRRQAVLGKLYELENKNSKLYEVLELMGKDAPNLGDLTRRLRANNDEVKATEKLLLEIEEEQPPKAGITHADIGEMSQILVDIIKTTENPKKVRHFFSSFIDGVFVEDDHVRVEYRPQVLLNRAVHSTNDWLPGQDSNLRPKD